MDLSRLERVSIREVFKTETEFSDWIAKHANIIEEDLQIPGIEIIQREQQIGSFFVDILAKVGEHKAIIENQFESSDHDHLGKIITYAAGTDATIIIWLVENAREEHRAAIDWLNENMPDRYFFLGEIRAYKIGNSPVAINIYPVAVPNKWEKTSRMLFNMSVEEYRVINFFRAVQRFLEKLLNKSLVDPSAKDYYIFESLAPNIHFEITYYRRPKRHIAVGFHVETPDRDYNGALVDCIYSKCAKTLEREFEQVKHGYFKRGGKWAGITIPVEFKQLDEETAKNVAELAAKMYRIVQPIATVCINKYNGA